MRPPAASGTRTYDLAVACRARLPPDYRVTCASSFRGDPTSNLNCSCNKTCKEMTLDACRSVGPAVEPSTRVLVPQSSVKRSSGGRFTRSLSATQCAVTVRCDWLQVESCNIILMRAALQDLQDFSQVLPYSCDGGLTSRSTH